MWNSGGTPGTGYVDYGTKAEFDSSHGDADAVHVSDDILDGVLD